MRASAGEGLMKTPDFQAFVEQLGDLSEGQRQIVVAALKGKGSASDETWDTKTHITKDHWRKICERMLSE